MMNNVLSTLINYWLPQHCLCCGIATGSALAFCNDCAEELPRPFSTCSRCALPLVESAALCGECLRQPPSFSKVRAGFVYQPPVNSLIHRFKDRQQWYAAQSLTTLFGQSLIYQLEELGEQSRPDVLIPVPLHWQRLWYRGFNQSLFIAKALGQQLDIPVLTPLRRNKSTQSQQQLNRRQRLSNVSRGFELTGDVANLRIAVVDDVMTTGATLRELSHCLTQGGATWVEAWVLARTPKPP